MRVGLAYNAFFGSFQRFFPTLEVIPYRNTKLEYNLIIFPGGEDINPSIYGCSNTASSYTSERDSIEKNILLSAFEKHIKILGTCRGHQLVNAVLGGYLIQDLYTEKIGHDGYHGFDFKSNLPWIPNRVNSMHHQGVARPGNGLLVAATYKGIAEATVSKDVITVQWHPEFMSDTTFFDYITQWVEDKKFKINTNDYLPLNEYMRYSDRIRNRNGNGRSDNEPSIQVDDNPFGTTQNSIRDFADTMRVTIDSINVPEEIIRADERIHEPPERIATPTPRISYHTISTNTTNPANPDGPGLTRIYRIPIDPNTNEEENPQS